jgi:hypothetical protein
LCLVKVELGSKSEAGEQSLFIGPELVGGYALIDVLSLADINVALLKKLIALSKIDGRFGVLVSRRNDGSEFTADPIVEISGGGLTIVGDLPGYRELFMQAEKAP